MIEDHQQAGTAQPVGEHHPAAMHGTDTGAGIGADQYAVPLCSSIAAAWSAVAGDETSVHRQGGLPLAGRTARQSCHRRWIPAGHSARSCRWACLLLLLLTLAFGKQFALTSLLGLACLTGQRLFDGLEHPLELRLFTAASLQPLLSAGQVAVQQPVPAGAPCALRPADRVAPAGRPSSRRAGSAALRCRPRRWPAGAVSR